MVKIRVSKVRYLPSSLLVIAVLIEICKGARRNRERCEAFELSKVLSVAEVDAGENDARGARATRIIQCVLLEPQHPTAAAAHADWRRRARGPHTGACAHFRTLWLGHWCEHNNISRQHGWRAADPCASGRGLIGVSHLHGGKTRGGAHLHTWLLSAMSLAMVCAQSSDSVVHVLSLRLCFWFCFCFLLCMGVFFFLFFYLLFY